MLKYLHSFYFNQGEIIWICLKGERIKRADISGRNNVQACNWNLNENLLARLTAGAFPPTCPWLQTQTLGRTERTRALTVWSQRCWILFALFWVTYFENFFKRAFLSSLFMIPIGLYLFSFPCFIQQKGRRGVISLFPRTAKTSQELRVLCSMEEENIYFGLESYCFNYPVIS